MASPDDSALAQTASVFESISTVVPARRAAAGRSTPVEAIDRLDYVPVVGDITKNTNAYES